MVEVTYPLHQLMHIEANITIIYYPELSKAFRLESANPVILPLVLGLLAAIRPDYGLSDLGFKLSRQEMRGDTVTALWTHPKARNKIGEYRIAEMNDRLVYTRYESPDTRNHVKTNFTDYVNVSGIFFPTKISSEILNPAGHSLEKVIIEDLKVNPKIPNHIIKFKLPNDVSVEKKKW